MAAGIRLGFAALVALAWAHGAEAETVHRLSQVDAHFAVVNVVREKGFTEIHIKPLSEPPQRVIEPAGETWFAICWAESGPDAPFLSADGKRYRYLGGDNVSHCPRSRRYDGKVMVLRFEPLGADVRQFSLIEGVGGEKQLTGTVNAAAPYLNFVDIQLTQ